jgi:hypothetical protein
MKKDVTELKKMFLEILKNPALANSAANFTSESLQNDYLLNGEANYSNAVLSPAGPVFDPSPDATGKPAGDSAA